MERGKLSGRTSIFAALYPGLYDTVTRWKWLLSKSHMIVQLEFAKRYLKCYQMGALPFYQMRNKILRSDETQIALFGLNAKHHVWSIRSFSCPTRVQTGTQTSLERSENICAPTFPTNMMELQRCCKEEKRMTETSPKKVCQACKVTLRNTCGCQRLLSIFFICH